MIILPEDRAYMNLLSGDNAKELLLALVSDDPAPLYDGLTAAIYDTITTRNDRLSKSHSNPGKAGAPVGNRNAAKERNLDCNLDRNLDRSDAAAQDNQNNQNNLPNRTEPNRTEPNRTEPSSVAEPNARARDGAAAAPINETQDEKTQYETLDDETTTTTETKRKNVVNADSVQPLAEAINLLETKVLGLPCGETQREALTTALADGLEPDLITHAVRLTVDNSAKWAYTRKILANWSAMGIRTIADFERHEASRAGQTNPRASPDGFSNKRRNNNANAPPPTLEEDARRRNMAYLDRQIEKIRAAQNA